MSHIITIDHNVVANSHDSMSKYGPHKCHYTYDDGQKDKGDVGPVHCSVSGRRVLVPLPTFWSAHTRTVVQEEVL